MEITAKDVGRKVRLRNGDVVTIHEFDGSGVPVRVKEDWLFSNGRVCGSKFDNPYDIIAFADDVKTPKEIAQEILAELEGLIDLNIKKGEFKCAIDDLKRYVELYEEHFK